MLSLAAVPAGARAEVLALVEGAVWGVAAAQVEVLDRHLQAPETWGPGYVEWPVVVAGVHRVGGREAAPRVPKIGLCHRVAWAWGGLVARAAQCPHPVGRRLASEVKHLPQRHRFRALPRADLSYCSIFVGYTGCIATHVPYEPALEPPPTNISYFLTPARTRTQYGCELWHFRHLREWL